MSADIFEILIFEILNFSVSTGGREVGHVKCACLKLQFWSCCYLLLSLERNSPDSTAFSFPLLLLLFIYILTLASAILLKLSRRLLASFWFLRRLLALFDIFATFDTVSHLLLICAVCQGSRSLLFLSLWLVACLSMVLSVREGSAHWHCLHHVLSASTVSSRSLVGLWMALRSWRQETWALFLVLQQLSV